MSAIKYISENNIKSILKLITNKFPNEEFTEDEIESMFDDENGNSNSTVVSSTGETISKEEILQMIEEEMDKESTSREDADEDLQKQITQEATDRTSDIATEKSERQAEIATERNRIDILAASVNDVEENLFSGSYSDLTDKPTIPTNTSQLINDSGYITTDTNATSSDAGLMSADDKSKLDGIAAGAQVNTVTGVKGNNETSYRTGDINITAANIGLGNVGNFKAVSTVANQGLTTTEQSNARTNIGAGTSSFSGSYSDLSNKPTIPTVNNATLTIQKNGSNVATFTSNASSNVTANITVPTSVKELSGYSDYALSEYYASNGISLGRASSTTKGSYSVAIGTSITASGSYSQGMGYKSVASGDYSHAEGNQTTASGEESHAEGYKATASTKYAHAEGSATTASGYAAHAEGYGSKALGNYSHAEGVDTTANSEYSAHAEGANTSSTGLHSHAEGFYTTASGNHSHAEGYGPTASGVCSHAEGSYTTALGNQHAQGHYNDTTLATAGPNTGTGTGTAFVIGNGTSSSALSNAARIDYNGKLWCKAAYASTGADYAEYFEWLDGNPDNEDRRGKFVTMNGDKIEFAKDGDYILGIVSAQPCVLGNTDMEWNGQYLKDEFGAYIKEKTIEKIKVPKEVTDSEGNITMEEVEEEQEVEFYKVNPDYDESKGYTQRDDRPEWSAIGMLGVLAAYDDGTCEVNGYCKCNDDSIATKSDTGYRVIKRVSDNIVKIVLK